MRKGESNVGTNAEMIAGEDRKRAAIIELHLMAGDSQVRSNGAKAWRKGRKRNGFAEMRAKHAIIGPGEPIRSWRGIGRRVENWRRLPGSPIARKNASAVQICGRAGNGVQHAIILRETCPWR